MRRSLFLAPLLMLIACGKADPADIVVHDAWARETPPGATVGAVYARIDNRGGTDDRLLKVETGRAAMAMLHGSSSDDGVMRMRAIGSLALPAGQTVALAPGATHVMLEGLSEPLVRGQRFAVIMTFEQGGARTVPVTVAATGER